MQHYLHQCLLSVQKALAGIEGEIWVVDNHSSDNSLTVLQPLFPSVHFLVNTHNTGFSAANNQAIKQARGKYLLLLNPDTLVPEDAFTTCLQLSEKDTRIGAIGCRMINGRGRYLPESKRAIPALLNSFFKLCGLAALFPQSALFNQYALGHLNAKDQYEVPVLAGAFMMVQKSLVQQLGGFDERFFMYGEDIDLCLRIQQAGYKNYYAGNITIVHFKGQSTRQNNRHYLQHFYGAMYLFTKKHHRFWWLMAPFIYLRASLAWLTTQLQQRAATSANWNTARQTLFVGSEQDFTLTQSLPIIQNLQHPLRFLDASNTNFQANQLPTYCKQAGIEQLIIGANAFSMKAQIELLQEMPSVNTCFLLPGATAVTGCS